MRRAVPMPSRHAPPWVFEATNSHLYAGAHLRSAAPVAQLPLRVGDPVVITFADQTVGTGEVSQVQTPQDWTLHLHSRTTAKGTPIASQTWRVKVDLHAANAESPDSPDAARTLRVRRP